MAGPYTTENYALDDTSTALKANSSGIFAYKELVTGGISGTNGPEGARPGTVHWTLVSSSDGTTAGAGDNLGGATYNAAKWIWAAEGVAHSWFVIESQGNFPNEKVQLCFNLNGAGPAIDIVMARGAGAFSGGSTTNRPTASVETKYEQAGGTGMQLYENNAVAGKAHLVIYDTGEHLFLTSKNTSGCFNVWFRVGIFTDGNPADTAPFYMQGQFQTSSGRGVGQMWDNSGGFVSWRGFTYDGLTAVTNSTANLAVVYFNGGSQWGTIVDAAQPNGLVGHWPTAPLFDNTTAKKMVRGRVRDTWSVGAPKPVGSPNPVTGDIVTVIVGTVAVKMSVAPSL